MLGHNSIGRRKTRNPSCEIRQVHCLRAALETQAFCLAVDKGREHNAKLKPESVERPVNLPSVGGKAKYGPHKSKRSGGWRF